MIRLIAAALTAVVLSGVGGFSGAVGIFVAGAAATPTAELRRIHADPGLMLAEPCSSGCAYTWTLATRFGQALRAAEARFGRREAGWTLLGVEFARVDAPQVWYPSFSETNRQIVVQLTADAAQDERRALYQLAHEVVHLLNPKRDPVSRFEEGLATLFSIQHLRAQGFSLGPEYIGSSRYRAAYDDVARLESLHPRGRFDVAVRLLRQNADGLSPLTPALIAQAFPNAPADLAAALSRPFWSDAGATVEK